MVQQWRSETSRELFTLHLRVYLHLYEQMHTIAVFEFLCVAMDGSVRYVNKQMCLLHYNASFGKMALLILSMRSCLENGFSCSANTTTTLMNSVFFSAVGCTWSQ